MGPSDPVPQPENRSYATGILKVVKQINISTQLVEVPSSVSNEDTANIDPIPSSVHPVN